jgi:signal transduction histidine kinase
MKVSEVRTDTFMTRLRRLFQPFSKSAHEAAHTAPGIGLGLALCRRLSRSMGGDLRLIGRGEHGACFELRLPLNPPPAAAAALG